MLSLQCELLLASLVCVSAVQLRAPGSIRQYVHEQSCAFASPASIAFPSRWRACASSQPVASEVDEVNVVGKTAFCANVYRVLSEQKLSKPLYFDGFGHVFLNSWTEEHMKILEKTSFYSFIYELALRTAFYDEHVRRATAVGVKQVVIIGSGLDCRPLRLHDPAVTFFEFDQPTILDYKVAKLSSLQIPPYPSRLIPGDYLELSFKDELEAVGFNAGEPALFIWEGNTMYLKPERTTRLMRNILASFPRAQIAFDCVSPAISGALPPTADTKWFYDFTSMFVDNVGTNKIWEAGNVRQWSEEVPFQIVEETSMWDLSEKYRDEQTLVEMYGSRRRFEETQGWMKHYMHVLVKPP